VLLVVPFLWRFQLRHSVLSGRGTTPPDVLLRRFRYAFALNGAAWGLASVVLFPAQDLGLQMVLTFVVTGISASALTAAAFDVVAGVLFLATAIVPLSVRMFVEGGAVASSMSATLALYLGYMAANALRIHRRYVEAFSLRRSAAARADALAMLQAAVGRLWQMDTTDPLEVTRAATSELIAALRLDRAFVCRFDRGQGVAAVVATAGARAAPGTHSVVPLTSIAAYDAALTQSTRLVNDQEVSRVALAELDGTTLALTAGAHRLDVPLRIGGRVDGVVCCERTAGPWTEDETSFVTATAATILAATEEARRRETERDLRDLHQSLERRIDERTLALQRSEARLALALDVSNDGLWEVVLPEGRVYFSPVWARLLGFGPTEVPRTVAELKTLVHPDDLGRLEAAIQAHIAGRVPASDLEVRLRTKSGEYRWFRDRGRVVERGDNGRPRRMIGTIADVTDRRLALDALHESDSRFRALFDESPVILTLVDVAEGRIAEMNAVGLEMFGYTREEAIGRTTAELGLWVDEGERRRAARQLLDTGVVSGLELELRCTGGGTFWALLSCSLVTLKGEPYALVTLQDVTGRRELEARVLQSQKMEVVGHLAGGIAHDFNNVLTVIASTAELGIADARAADPARDALETIRQASTRASGLTRQLLAFSRRQVLQPAAVNLREVIAALEPMVRRAVGEKVAVRLHANDSPATVFADLNSLDQVVLNLAINARDAMPDGGVLEMTTGATVVDGAHGRSGTLAPGRYVTLAIRDSGTGMSEATRRRVFEPFFTTKEVGKGTGLGLSVAHGIVTQSGGDIVVESTLGAGTTFTIYLPAAGQAPELATPAGGRVSTGRGRVLVVDDDDDIRAVLGRALTFAGYEIVAAGNGVEALQMLETDRGPVDLLLTDVVMPAMGGRELAEHVRERFPATRILFTSGYAENAIVHQGVLAEGVDFIAKPYSLQALTEKVRDVLAR
jgi:PAS domain S-box-containing protein